jgi:hypothetical protein
MTKIQWSEAIDSATGLKKWVVRYEVTVWFDGDNVLQTEVKQDKHLVLGSNKDVIIAKAALVSQLQQSQWGK